MVNVGKYMYNYPMDLMGYITNPKHAVLLGNSLNMIQNNHTFALVDPAKKKDGNLMTPAVISWSQCR